MHDIKEYLSESGLAVYEVWASSEPKSVTHNKLLEILQANDMINTTCNSIREKNKLADAKRSGRKRIDSDSRLEKKKIWEQNNRDKRLSYCRKSRENKKMKDFEGFNKHNSNTHKVWTHNNPEKISKHKDTIKKKPEYKFGVYACSAASRNLDFKLNFEYCEFAFNSECFYCNFKSNEGYLNGIDRIDSAIGYIEDNCVPCCEMCNMMKWVLSVNFFFGICRNILANCGIINIPIDDDYDVYSISGDFNSYKYSAEKRGKKFEIDKIFFETITSKPCYLCGKKNIKNIHRNGIDRKDNNIGYVEGNCESCCRVCNMTKKNYDHGCFLKQLEKIYYHSQLDKFNEPSGMNLEQKTMIYSVEDDYNDDDDDEIEQKNNDLVDVDSIYDKNINNNVDFDEEKNKKSDVIVVKPNNKKSDVIIVKPKKKRETKIDKINEAELDLMIQNIDILPDDHKKLDVIDAKNTNKSTDKNVDKTKKNDVIIVKQKKKHGTINEDNTHESSIKNIDNNLEKNKDAEKAKLNISKNKKKSINTNSDTTRVITNDDIDYSNMSLSTLLKNKPFHEDKIYELWYHRVNIVINNVEVVPDYENLSDADFLTYKPKNDNVLAFKKWSLINSQRLITKNSENTERLSIKDEKKTKVNNMYLRAMKKIELNNQT